MQGSSRDKRNATIQKLVNPMSIKLLSVMNYILLLIIFRSCLNAVIALVSVLMLFIVPDKSSVQ